MLQSGGQTNTGRSWCPIIRDSGAPFGLRCNTLVQLCAFYMYQETQIKNRFSLTKVLPQARENFDFTHFNAAEHIERKVNQFVWN